MGASCFFIGHRETGGDVVPALTEAVERHITDYGVTDFYVGHYGGFDGLAAQAVKEARERHPEIRLTLVLPYHPAIRPVNTPKGFDGTFYPWEDEKIPKRLAIIKTNQRMVDTCDYLITYRRTFQRGGDGVYEQEIIELISNRDEQGMTELLRHYGPLMRYIIAPILRDPQDQEDCLSEIAMRVWDKISLFDQQRGSWNAWLTSLARNAALNRARQIKPTLSTDDIPENKASPEPTPEEIILRQERQAAVNRALRQLSQKERSLFYRKYYYLQSTAQIASELGMTERAVEGKLYRLKKQLRKVLGGEGYE